MSRGIRSCRDRPRDRRYLRAGKVAVTNSHLIMNSSQPIPKGALILITVSATGDFVAGYDVIIFSVVRTASLSDARNAERPTCFALGLPFLTCPTRWRAFRRRALKESRRQIGQLSVLSDPTNLVFLSKHLECLCVGPYLAIQVAAIYRHGVGLAGELEAWITLVSEDIASFKQDPERIFVPRSGFGGIHYLACA